MVPVNPNPRTEKLRSVAAHFPGLACRLSSHTLSRMKPVHMAAMILTLLVIYVLSPGPLNLWFGHAHEEAPKAVVTFYAPLRWLYEKSPTVQVAYDWYFKTLGP